MAHSVNPAGQTAPRALRRSLPRRRPPSAAPRHRDRRRDLQHPPPRWSCRVCCRGRSPDPRSAVMRPPCPDPIGGRRAFYGRARRSRWALSRGDLHESDRERSPRHRDHRHGGRPTRCSGIATYAAPFCTVDAWELCHRSIRLAVIWDPNFGRLGFQTLMCVSVAAAYRAGRRSIASPPPSRPRRARGRHGPPRCGRDRRGGILAGGYRADAHALGREMRAGSDGRAVRRG